MGSSGAVGHSPDPFSRDLYSSLAPEEWPCPQSHPSPGVAPMAGGCGDKGLPPRLDLEQCWRTLQLRDCRGVDEASGAAALQPSPPPRPSARLLSHHGTEACPGDMVQKHAEHIGNTEQTGISSHEAMELWTAYYCSQFQRKAKKTK